MEILIYAREHWVQWLFAAAVGVLSWGYKKIYDKLKTEQEKNSAISDGVQALLRESIVNSYNKYSDRRYCPIYAKESIKKAYKAYEALGGNDVAHQLYEKILVMPEAPSELEGGDDE